MIKLLKFTALTIIILIIAGFVYLNTMFKSDAEKYASRLTGTNVEITFASINPFKGTIDIAGLDVGNPKGFVSENAIEFNSLMAEIEISSLLTKVIQIKKMELNEPVVNYEVTSNGDNIQTLLRNVKSAKKPSSKEPKKLMIENLNIRGGKARFAADVFGLKADEELILHDLHLTNIGTAKGGVTTEHLSEIILSKISNELLKLKTQVMLKKIGLGGKVGNAIGDLLN